MKARYPGVCPLCEGRFAAGNEISRFGDGWAHGLCARLERDRLSLLSAPERPGRKRSSYRLGKGPGSYS